MKLLIITQKVNASDPVLGFFHRWILEFAKHCQQVTVICLEKGQHHLPENVRVLSLDKEGGKGKIVRLVRFWKYVYKERSNYDKVFVHMNPIYIVLAGWWWRYFQKKGVFLWYTHKHVDWKLKWTEKFVNKIFTASEESLRLDTSKKVVTGHGIDTTFFQPNIRLKANGGNFCILTVGRLSETKGHELIIKATEILRSKDIPANLLVIGGPVTKKDDEYVKKIKKEVQKNNSNFVSFLGPLPHSEVVSYFQKVDVFVNASQTESLDKTILEAMACETLIVSSNDSAIGILEKFDDNLIFEKNNVNDLVRSLEYCYQNNQRLLGLKKSLRQEVIDYHNLSKLIEHLFSVIN